MRLGKDSAQGSCRSVGAARALVRGWVVAQPRFGDEMGSMNAGVPGAIVRSNFLRRNVRTAFGAGAGVSWRGQLGEHDSSDCLEEGTD